LDEFFQAESSCVKVLGVQFFLIICWKGTQIKGGR